VRLRKEVLVEDAIDAAASRPLKRKAGVRVGSPFEVELRGQVEGGASLRSEEKQREPGITHEIPHHRHRASAEKVLICLGNLTAGDTDQHLFSTSVVTGFGNSELKASASLPYARNDELYAQFLHPRSKLVGTF